MREVEPEGTCERCAQNVVREVWFRQGEGHGSSAKNASGCAGTIVCNGVRCW